MPTLVETPFGPFQAEHPSLSLLQEQLQIKFGLEPEHYFLTQNNRPVTEAL